MNPFDLRSVLFAKHAQHVVLVHFPIALFLTGTLFDFAARYTRRSALARAASLNTAAAAASVVPVVVTGLLAWQWQLDGVRLKGSLLLHLALGALSTLLICAFVWLRRRLQHARSTVFLPNYLLVLEAVAAFVVALAAHLGGVVSGVAGGA